MRTGVSISTILAFSYAQDSFIEGQPGPGDAFWISWQIEWEIKGLKNLNARHQNVLKTSMAAVLMTLSVQSSQPRWMLPKMGLKSV